jgi:hypothetical protein
VSGGRERRQLPEKDDPQGYRDASERCVVNRREREIGRCQIMKSLRCGVGVEKGEGVGRKTN